MIALGVHMIALGVHMIALGVHMIALGVHMIASIFKFVVWILLYDPRSNQHI